MPSALVIRTAGTNCDAEMVRAFEVAGARATLLHLDRLIADPARLDAFELIAFPGGFSYGDDVASGRIFAMRLRTHLYPALRKAAQRGVLMIGACNGFQVMVQAGLLPGPASGQWPQEAPPQETSLTFNAGGRFIDRWVEVEPDPRSVCLWTRGLCEAFGPPTSSTARDVMRLPIAHGEGRFVAASPAVIDRLRAAGQIALRYAARDNPNGSSDDIAGICDPSGRIFALMPHPERYLDWNRHPYWTRLDASVRGWATPGRKIFENAVGAARRGLSGQVSGLESEILTPTPQVYGTAAPRQPV